MQRGPVDVLFFSFPADVDPADAARVDQDLADVQAELALYVRVPPEDVEAALAAGRG